jgi:uncharacterized protein YecT (DUF1311 family)
MTRWLCIVALMLMPAVASAQLAEVQIQDVRACLGDALPGETAPDCLGKPADNCIADTNDEMRAITACIDAETAAWDLLLNEQYRGLSTTLRQRDPDLPVLLRDAQRAWISYRDAQCAFDHARWRDGGLRSVVKANCMMTTTAQRTLELRDMREE